MKQTTLNINGFPVIIDTEDLNVIAGYSLYCYGRYVYVYKKGGTSARRKSLYLHSLLLNTQKPFCTDHIDGNRLNNSRSNLRISTYSQNVTNKPKFSNNPYKGIHKDRGLWRAAIGVNGKCFKMNRYKDAEDAAIEYNVAAQLFFGDYAYLNNV